VAKKLPDKRGVHGRYAMSAATRKRLLGQLLDQAESGDPVAAGVLIALSLRHENRQVSATGRVCQVQVAPA